MGWCLFWREQRAFLVSVLAYLHPKIRNLEKDIPDALTNNKKACLAVHVIGGNGKTSPIRASRATRVPARRGRVLRLLTMLLIKIASIFNCFAL